MIIVESMLSNNIQIAPKTIGKLLKEERLKVPPSQRSYRWKIEHIEDLYRDIRTAIDNGAEEYFLGSIVSIDTDGSILIYDGQQRLATTMILIAAIRDSLLVLGNEKDAKIAEGHYLFSERRGAVDPDPHLTLNLEDRDFFFKRILPRTPPKEKRSTQNRIRDSHKRLEAAAKTAKEFVAILTKGRSTDDSNTVLNKWLDFIETSLQIIWVQVADERTAFTIFETMNDRGLKLSAADLLKNFLHAKAENHRDEVLHKWSSMRGVLETVEGEEENVVEYMRCFWVSRHGHTRTRYLYDKIKEKTVNKVKALALVSDLEDCSQDYAAIIMASHERTIERGEATKSAISTLRTLGVTQLRPMLLSAFTKFQHNQFTKLVEQCVAWSVRFLISGTPSGTIEGYYSRIAVDIWSEKITKAHEALSSIRAIIPKDDEFCASFASATENKARIARYYLQALQKTVDGTSAPDSLTLEHLLDKEYDSKRHPISEEEHSVYLNRLGNLALIDEAANGSMQGMTFPKKVPILKRSSNPSLTIQVATYSKWSTSEIEARQKGLADLAVKTWPIL